MTTTIESVRKDIRQVLERVACRAFLSTSQVNITQDNWTKVNLNAVTYDLGKNFALDTYKFTAPVSGLYHIIGQVFLTDSVIADKRYMAGIYKNGAVISCSGCHASIANFLSSSVNDEVYLRKDDYIELYIYNQAGAGTVDILSDAVGLYTFLVVRLISKEGTKQ